VRIALVGTDAPFAPAVIAQAIERGHRVRALVEHAGVLHTSHVLLEAVQSEPGDRERATHLMDGVEALLVAGPEPPLTLGDLIGLAEAAGVRRVIAMTDPDEAPPDRPAGGMDVRLLRPARLVDGPRTGRYRLLPPTGSDDATTISCPDVAHAMLDELERRVPAEPLAIVSW
jgi:putative NADH-flavin reductase